MNVHLKTVSRSKEEIGIGFRMLYLVACDDRNLRTNLKDLESLPRKVPSAAGSDCPWQVGLCQKRQQVLCTRKGPNVDKFSGICLGMTSLELICLVRSYWLSCLSQQRAGE